MLSYLVAATATGSGCLSAAGAGSGPRFRGFGRARQHGFEFLEEFGYVARAQDERRQQPQNVLVRAVDQQAARERFGDERRAFDRKIDALDQALAAQLADEIETRRELFEAGAKLGAALADVGEKIVVFDDREKFERGGADQRAATESCPMHPGWKAEANRSLAMKAPSGRPAASGFATVTMSGSSSNF